MNKYQIALNSFVECANEKTCGITTYESIFGEYESIEIMKKDLQELADKETPMKPALLVSHKKQNKRQYQCLRCGNACLVRYAPFERNENKYCYDCGQKIDWSEDDE